MYLFCLCKTLLYSNFLFLYELYIKRLLKRSVCRNCRNRFTDTSTDDNDLFVWNSLSIPSCVHLGSFVLLVILASLRHSILIIQMHLEGECSEEIFHDPNFGCLTAGVPWSTSYWGEVSVRQEKEVNRAEFVRNLNSCLIPINGKNRERDLAWTLLPLRQRHWTGDFWDCTTEHFSVGGSSWRRWLDRIWG